MLRFIILAAVATLACKLVFGRWPWEYLASPGGRTDAAAQARKLLGVRPGASEAEILEAHRRLVATVHPDRGGSSEQVHDANTARDILLGRSDS
jgi:hypothetical protein